MIAIMVALMAEAKPIIAHFGLTPQDMYGPYPIWGNDKIRLTVSGVGKVAAASATTYLLTKEDPSSPFFTAINIGIAGHKDLEIGTAILGHKISDNLRKKNYYPTILFDHSLLEREIHTIDIPSDNYESDYLFDMEAIGFFQAASKFLPCEYIHSVKIISDNAKTSHENIRKKTIYELIANNYSALISVIEGLKRIKEKEKEVKKTSYEADLEPFFQKFHFTKTERYQLKELIYKLFSLDPKMDMKSEIKDHKSGKEILKSLKTRLKKTPVFLEKKRK